MNKTILEKLRPLVGKKCCRARIGDSRSLSLGFGRRIRHGNPKLLDKFYGEWEIGTYYCAWRVRKKNTILLAKNDHEEKEGELDERLQRINFGRIRSIDQTTRIDVRVSFEDGIFVEFLATISDDDEYFHVFGPDNFHIDLSRNGKWTVSKSNEPYFQTAATAT